MEVRGTPDLAASDLLLALPRILHADATRGPLIYVATQPVDLRRRGLLTLLAKETLGHDSMNGVAGVFRSKRTDRVKIVVRDGSGLVMYWKRLDGSGVNGMNLRELRKKTHSARTRRVRFPNLLFAHLFLSCAFKAHNHGARL